MRQPSSVVDGTASAADTAALGGAFVAATSGGGARYRALAARLDEGVPFDEAFGAVFKASAPKLFEAWLGKEGKPRAGGAGR
jgi:3-deoxy-D-arabino-heptulosonate 7-phosphate (DAHP) synthase class II